MPDQHRRGEQVEFVQPGGWQAYALMAGAALIIALAVGFYLSANLSDLRRGSAFSEAYYILLLIIGVAVAFAVFGAMQSSARVNGAHFETHWQVGGPAAAVVLVVLGGIYLPPKSSDVSILFRLVGPDPGMQLVQGARAEVFAGRKSRVLTFPSEIPEISWEGLPATVRQTGVEIAFYSAAYRPARADRTYKVNDDDVVIIDLVRKTGALIQIDGPDDGASTKAHKLKIDRILWAKNSNNPTYLSQDAVRELSQTCEDNARCDIFYSSLAFRKFAQDPWNGVGKDLDVFYTCDGQPKHAEVKQYAPGLIDNVDVHLSCSMSREDSSK